MLTAFSARIEHDATIPEGYMQHFVAVPDEVAQRCLDAGHPRVVGTLVGPRVDARPIPFRRSLQRRTEGGWCLRFGRAWLRDACLEPGEALAVELGPDPHPEQVEIPIALEGALALDPEVDRYWQRLTPGRRRTLAYPIERLKSETTQRKKAEALVAALRVEMEGGEGPGPRRRR